VCRRSSLLTTEGGAGGEGAKSYDGETARSAINRSILPGFNNVKTSHTGDNIHHFKYVHAVRSYTACGQIPEAGVRKDQNFAMGKKTGFLMFHLFEQRKSDVDILLNSNVTITIY
jgi:hypothetical protein